uniref:Uncharacterized protein n=1 Tax=Arundo donax TaxID=35708 RepID=A0A0A9HWY1_ARUDO
MGRRQRGRRDGAAALHCAEFRRHPCSCPPTPANSSSSQDGSSALQLIHDHRDTALAAARNHLRWTRGFRGLCALDFPSSVANMVLPEGEVPRFDAQLGAPVVSQLGIFPSPPSFFQDCPFQASNYY